MWVAHKLQFELLAARENTLGEYASGLISAIDVAMAVFESHGAGFNNPPEG